MLCTCIFTLLALGSGILVGLGIEEGSSRVGGLAEKGYDMGGDHTGNLEASRAI
jgi:hypothetical protein